jgi:hypothetical protein
LSHVFIIINVTKVILLCGAAPQVLSILYLNVAELAGVGVHYIKPFQMLAKEIMACIQSKTGDLLLCLPTLDRFTVSFD